MILVIPKILVRPGEWSFRKLSCYILWKRGWTWSSSFNKDLLCESSGQQGQNLEEISDSGFCTFWVWQHTCLLNGGLDKSRSNLAFERSWLRNNLIFGMLYLHQRFNKSVILDGYFLLHLEFQMPFSTSLIVHESTVQSDCWFWVMCIEFDTQWNTLDRVFIWHLIGEEDSCHMHESWSPVECQMKAR